MSMKKPLLFLAHRIPYPPNKGEKIRSFNFLRHLSERHEIHLAALIDDQRDLAFREQLRPWVKECCFDFINPRLKKIVSAIAPVLREPITVRYFYSRRLQREIDRMISRLDFEYVLCSSSPMAEYLFRAKSSARLFQQASTSMDLIDVDSYKWRQYAQSANWPLRWVYRREAENLLAYERRIAERFNHILLTSENEKRLFLEGVPGAGSVIAVPNGVDLEFFSPLAFSAEPGAAPKIVFTGAMDYFPNVDGVCWFVAEVLPRLRARIPGLCFEIVGSRPAPAVQALAKEAGVSVTGFVDDIRPYLAEAAVCVVPLRIARGIQNKVLEAMAMGRPVVATPQALGGIAARIGEDVYRAASAEEFAEKVIALVENRELAASLGRAGRKCVEENYAWAKNLKSLDALLA